MRGDVVFRVYGLHEGREADSFFGAFRSRAEADAQARRCRSRRLPDRRAASPRQAHPYRRPCGSHAEALEGRAAVDRLAAGGRGGSNGASRRSELTDQVKLPISPPRVRSVGRTLPGDVLELVSLAIAGSMLSQAELDPIEVKFLRKLLEYTQAELAVHLGLDRATANRWAQEGGPLEGANFLRATVPRVHAAR
jgi:hypothetical protein